MGVHPNDLKIWLFARSEEGENIKITCKKAWKKTFHITNYKFFFQVLNVNIYKNSFSMRNPKV